MDDTGDAGLSGDQLTKAVFPGSDAGAAINRSHRGVKLERAFPRHGADSRLVRRNERRILRLSSWKQPDHHWSVAPGLGLHGTEGFELDDRSVVALVEDINGSSRTHSLNDGTSRSADVAIAQTSDSATIATSPYRSIAR